MRSPDRTATSTVRRVGQEGRVVVAAEDGTDAADAPREHEVAA
jgi:hypothetical protein